MDNKLIEVKDLKKYYPVTAGLLLRHIGDIRAVDGVSFDIAPGETLGLVGESGCGKSTLGRTLLRLEEPTAGTVYYRGNDISQLKRSGLRMLRREAQMIFQDPQSSLDPRMTIGESIEEALIVQEMGDEKDRLARVKELLIKVGLEPEHASRYPHELSGGQKQRVGVGRALAVNPRLIVCDEPVSALDVSIQAQVLNLLMDLQDELQLAYLFIAHDLAVIRHISHRISVMYLGKIMEIADKAGLFSHPRHPYTEALLSAIPAPDPRQKRKVILLQGEVPSPANPPPGCRFHTRCHQAKEICRLEEPVLTEIDKNHLVACHLY